MRTEGGKLNRASKSKVGVIQINGLGDCLLGVPVLRAIQARSSDLIVLVPPSSTYDEALLDIRYAARHVSAFRYKSTWVIDVDETESLLRNCSDVLFMVDWVSADLLTLRSRLEEAGIQTWVHPFVSGHGIAEFARLHQADRNLDLARQLFGPETEHVLIREPRPMCRQRPHIAVHPETTASSKTYEISEWVRLIETIADSKPMVDISIHGREFANTIHLECRCKTTAFDSVARSMHVVANSNMLIGIDSYLLHFTDLIGVPGIALFRTTDPARWGPRFTSTSRVFERLDLTCNQSIDLIIDSVSSLLSEARS